MFALLQRFITLAYFVHAVGSLYKSMPSGMTVSSTEVLSHRPRNFFYNHKIIGDNIVEPCEVNKNIQLSFLMNALYPKVILKFN